MKSLRQFIFLTLLIMAASCGNSFAASKLPMPGINLSGGEYGSISTNNKIDKNYVYPSISEIDYFTKLGVRVFRVPFLIERFEPNQNGPLDPTQLADMDAIVQEAAKDKACIILDAHNYGRAWGQNIGTTATPTASFAHFWSLMAGHYKSQPNTIIDIMNEPHNQTASTWAGIDQSAITAIREAKFKNSILVSGSDWDGGYSWINSGNAVSLLNIEDPLNNIVFEAHQYLNPGNTGQNCNLGPAASAQLAGITAWAEKNNKKLWLGETGACSDTASLTAFSALLNYLNQNNQEWRGITYWTGGPWMGNYIYTVDPSESGVESVQLKTLLNYAKH
jgi:endoglucanase